MKRLLLIALILQFFIKKKEKSHGGGNFKGFGKDNSKGLAINSNYSALEIVDLSKNQKHIYCPRSNTLNFY